ERTVVHNAARPATSNTQGTALKSPSAVPSTWRLATPVGGDSSVPLRRRCHCGLWCRPFASTNAPSPKPRSNPGIRNERGRAGVGVWSAPAEVFIRASYLVESVDKHVPGVVSCDTRRGGCGRRRSAQLDRVLAHVAAGSVFGR